MRLLSTALLTVLLAAWASAAEKSLQIFFVDVEGGQATLFVTPEGQSLLVDTGWGYNAFRDANRIAAAAKLAKIKKIDYVLVTHYHSDHVGGVPQLAKKVTVDHYIDHGPNRETSKAAETLFSEYQTAIARASRMEAKPGETLPIKGMNVTFVSADGNLIDRPLSSAGAPNQACDGVEQKATDPTENARSIGMVIDFGKLRIVDLGDLTWAKELQLMCPTNKLGHADIFIVSHHGADLSNSPALVHGLSPRVAIMDNGNKKGGAATAWDIVKSSPGIQDIWQLHFADANGSEHNTSDPFIANVDETDAGHYLKLTARANGAFEIYNPRNKYSKEYSPAH